MHLSTQIRLVCKVKRSRIILSPPGGGSVTGRSTIEWKLCDTHWLNWSVSYCWLSVLVESAQSSPFPSISPHSPLGWVTTHTHTWTHTYMSKGHRKIPAWAVFFHKSQCDSINKIQRWHNSKYNSGSDDALCQRLVYLEVVVVGHKFFICVSRQWLRIRWGNESWMLWARSQTMQMVKVLTCGNVLQFTSKEKHFNCGPTWGTRYYTLLIYSIYTYVLYYSIVQYKKVQSSIV